MSVNVVVDDVHLELASAIELRPGRFPRHEIARRAGHAAGDPPAVPLDQIRDLLAAHGVRARDDECKPLER
jgi:hypothetical protein